MALPGCRAPACARVVDGAAALPRAVCSDTHFCGDVVSDSWIFECFLFPVFIRSRSFSICGVRANIRICCRRHCELARTDAAFPSTYRLRVCWHLVVEDGGLELGAKSHLPRHGNLFSRCVVKESSVSDCAQQPRQCASPERCGR